jgi:uncharacterized protein (TIGR02466 family)
MNNEYVLSPANELIYVKDMTDIIDFKSINTEFNKLLFVNNEFNEISNGLQFFDNNIFENTKKLLELECETYLNECYNIKDMYDSITITNSWGNKTKPKQSHHEHMHPLSVVSGVIYLDNNVDNLNLNFVLQNRGAEIPYFMDQDKEARMSLKSILEMSGHDPKIDNNLKNHVILFLSNLKHYVTPTPNNSLPRKSISFNTFWKGMIGQKGNALGTISFDKVSVLSEHKI